MVLIGLQNTFDCKGYALSRDEEIRPDLKHVSLTQSNNQKRSEGGADPAVIHDGMHRGRVRPARHNRKVGMGVPFAEIIEAPEIPPGLAEKSLER